MKEIDNSKGVISKVQMLKNKVLLTASLAVFAALLGACGGGGTAVNSTTGAVDPNETAATVNGKPIKMEDVERAVFRVNASYARDLRDALHPGRRREEKGRRRRRG